VELGNPDGFHVLWRRAVGKGYSGVSVHGDRAATMMSIGEADCVVMLDAKTGGEQWRHRIEENYPRRVGAMDWPVSTPAIDEDGVYAISPRGMLLCLEAADGALRWAIDLKERFGAREPFYGFATSPLLEGDRLIVQVGRRSEADDRGAEDGSSLVAMDRRTGKMLWRAEPGWTIYTSPTAATLCGVRQVVVQSAIRVFAVRMDDGSLLWEFPLSAGGYWTPLAIEGDRVFVSADARSMMLQVSRSGSTWRAEQIWSTPRMGGVVNPVVYHDGMILGANSVNSRRLTAVDAETGKLLWVRRHDAIPLLVGEWLLVLADRAGTLHLGRPTREGFSPMAEWRLFVPEGNARVESPMAFADGVLYVRRETEILAVGF
jgi:outer membrane protein assembly factor BamB